jgi:hypothetical protein
MSQQQLRESWLQKGILELTSLFQAKGYIVPACLVSCGFASSGTKLNHIGQCWSRKSSSAEINQIFISPVLSDPVEVLDTLLHELIHAVDDCEHKHGKEFKKMALRLGMKGPMRSAGAGPELRAVLETISLKLGPYPHSQLKVSRFTRTNHPRPSAKCPECKYQVPMFKKFLEYGPPLCPKHKIEMLPKGNWEN